MDLPSEAVIAGAAAMAGAIAVLYRRQTKSDDRCEERARQHVEELARVRIAQEREKADFASITTKIATDQLSTNNRLATVLTDVGGVLYQAIKTLRRYEPQATPHPGSIDALKVRRKGDETTDFFEHPQPPHQKEYDHG